MTLSVNKVQKPLTQCVLLPRLLAAAFLSAVDHVAADCDNACAQTPSATRPV